MSGENEGLSSEQRRLLIVLGLPSLALALSVTAVSSMLPVILEDVSGTALAGGLLALEGVLALFVPTLIGGVSDRLRRRLPLVLVAAPLLVVAMLGLSVARSLPLIAAILLAFYLGYFTYFTAHFALYVDLVPEKIRGRSQGVMNLLREVGLGLALVGGPALLVIGPGAPFLLAAGVMTGISIVFALWLLRRGEEGSGSRSSGRGKAPDAGAVSADFRSTWRTLRERKAVRLVVIANALWETALNALRAFVVLYFTVGLGYSGQTTALVLLVVVLAALIGSPISGWLADRYGEVRVLRIASVVYAAGVWVPAFFHDIWVAAIIPPTAAAAVIVMTLPFALLVDTLEADSEGGDETEGGEASGVFGISRGIGLILGPLLGAVAITAAKDLLPQTHGYGAIFLVAAVALAASAVVIRKVPAKSGN